MNLISKIQNQIAKEYTLCFILKTVILKTIFINSLGLLKMIGLKNIPLYFLKVVFRHFCLEKSLRKILQKHRSIKIKGQFSIFDHATELCDIASMSIYSKIILKMPDSNNVMFAFKIGNINEKNFSRMFWFCRLMEEKKKLVYIVIDSEETYKREKINLLSKFLSNSIYKKNVTVVFTIQSYLKETYSELNSSPLKTGNVFSGIKLVRGAYLQYELKRKPSLVFSHKNKTDASFYACLKICINLLLNGHVKLIILASHNSDSIQDGLKFIKIRPQLKKKIVFTQLNGMSDCISNYLSQYDYFVYKYIPFGDFAESFPYLLRRIEETATAENALNFEKDQYKAALFTKIKTSVRF